MHVGGLDLYVHVYSLYVPHINILHSHKCVCSGNEVMVVF